MLARLVFFLAFLAVVDADGCLNPLASPFPLHSQFPQNGVAENTCPRGYHCPNLRSDDNTTWAQLCAPTLECSLTRLKLKPCDAQGTFEPSLCNETYYCPTPQVMLPCPKGYWCPAGTFEPFKCSSLSYCPERSSNRLDFAPILVALILDLSVILLSLAVKRYRQRLSHHRSEYAHDPLTEPASTTSVPTIVTERAPSSNHVSSWQPASVHQSDAVALLCKWITRSRSNQVIKTLQMDFFDLRLSLPNGQQLLKRVNGSLKPGRVTAVLGPSGAGPLCVFFSSLGDLTCTHVLSLSLSLQITHTHRQNHLAVQFAE